MRHIKVQTLNSIWIIEESDAGTRKVVEIKPNNGIMKPVHLSVLNESRDRVVAGPETGQLWGGRARHAFKDDIVVDRMWRSSKVVKWEDIDYG